MQTFNIKVATACMLLAASSGAFARSLDGEYGFTTLQSCVRTPYQQGTTPGFDPATKQLLLPGEIAEAVGSGIMTFSSDGSVSASVLGSELQMSQTEVGDTPVVSNIKYDCQGSYSFDTNNQVAVTLPECVVSSDPSVVVTVAPLELQGFVAGNKGSIELSLVNGSIQQVAVHDTAGNLLQQRERICIQTMSLDRVLPE